MNQNEYFYSLKRTLHFTMISLAISAMYILMSILIGLPIIVVIMILLYLFGG